ncbi:unnamed protein product [Penicillium salamii]|nr:unnamed protein product [Penicillium salamii]CAG8404756.1 unnamed protein product [Penicillium salamii]
MLPTFLAKNQYMNPTDSLKVPFQDAFGFSGDMFAFWKAFPKFGDLFDTHMGFQRDSSTDFLSVFKVMQEGKNILDDDVAFVDLGGGVGHQSARLKAICPDLPGRVILQDLPHVLDRALSTPGVEKLPCNLLELPPTKDAKFYYMRGVLHDFPDDKCQLILSNIAAAMANDSVLLVDEMVLPDKNIHWQAASMDLQMLSYLGSQERTRSHWSELTRSVGLSIQNVYFHKPTAYESLLVLIKDHRPISV